MIDLQYFSLAPLIYGHCKIAETFSSDGKHLLLGGYSITYDKDGNEVSRTENQWNVRIVHD